MKIAIVGTTLAVMLMISLADEAGAYQGGRRGGRPGGGGAVSARPGGMSGGSIGRPSGGMRLPSSGLGRPGGLSGGSLSRPGSVSAGIQPPSLGGISSLSRPNRPTAVPGLGARPGGLPGIGSLSRPSASSSPLSRPTPSPLGRPGGLSSLGSVSGPARPGGGLAPSLGAPRSNLGRPGIASTPGPGLTNRPGVTGRPLSLPGLNPGQRPSIDRPATSPALGNLGPGNRPGSGPSLSGSALDRPGLSLGANRPGLGSRPPLGGTPLGDLSGLGDRLTSRPGLDLRPGNRPDLGLDRPSSGPGTSILRPGINRPLGNLAGIDAGRPGLGYRPGERPELGGDRPTPLPAPGGRPGFGTQPGLGRPSDDWGVASARPGLGYRPGLGGNIINNSNIINNITNTNVNNITSVNSWGVGPGLGWAHPYLGYHAGWYNGCWDGFLGGYSRGYAGFWGGFGLGVGVGAVGWGLGSTLFDWGYCSYVNPYVWVDPAVVVEQPLGIIPTTVIDYSLPLDVQEVPADPAVADDAIAIFDQARAAFLAGRYDEALALTDRAIVPLPNDPVLHEFRALTLFALGRYDEAGAALYAVLSVGPGWNWKTLIGLYPGVEEYTRQIRRLEDHCRKHPDAPAPHFVLAYHYLTQGHREAALAQWREVVQLKPEDQLSARLIQQFQPAAPAEEGAAGPAQPAPNPPAVPAGELTGIWTASAGLGLTITLTIEAGGRFTWERNQNENRLQITGDWSFANGILTLVSSGTSGAMVGKTAWTDATHFTFQAVGAPAGDPGLTFTKQ